MFGGTPTHKKFPIGVAVTGCSVRLAQVTSTAQGYRLSACAKCDLPKGLSPGTPEYTQALGEAIRTALREGSFTGKLAISAQPPELLHYKNIRLPKMPAGELANAISWEAKERIHIGEPASVQFYNAGTVRQGEDERQEIVMLAAAESAIRAHAQAITQAGLTPETVDATAASLARLIGGSDDQAALILHTSESGIEVVIAHGQDVVFDKFLPTPDGLSLDHAEEMASEIGLCLRYYTVTFRAGRPEAAYLSGESPEGLGEQLAEALGLSFQSFNDAAELSADQGEDLGPWAVALGLSMGRQRPTDKKKRGAA